MKTIHPSQFGKDHWSTLAYVETCCVDDRGQMDKRRLRAHPIRHRIHAVNAAHLGNHWPDTYGSLLKDGMRPIASHDDWDCLNDLEAADYIEVVSEATARVAMTPLGNAVAGLLRAHKARGGHFATFELRAVEIVS